MRRGEIGALTWDAIDFERAVVTVGQAIGEDRRGHRFVKATKTERERVVPLDASALELGGMLDLNAVSRAFSTALAEAGIKAKDYSLHSLWHFVATQAMVSGIDVRTVAALLGHREASVTLDVYGHVVSGGRRRLGAGCAPWKLWQPP